MSRSALQSVMRELIRRNRIRTGLVYMQVTRGVARRDHPFPKNAKPAVVLTCKRIAPPKQETVDDGVKVITIPDLRWKRCDIKTVSFSRTSSASSRRVRTVPTKLGRSMKRAT